MQTKRKQYTAYVNSEGVKYTYTSYKSYPDAVYKLHKRLKDLLANKSNQTKKGSK